MPQPTTIADDVVVKIEYTLIVDSEVLDSSADEGPLEYLHGHDNIVAGLEAALSGKKVGDSLQVTISPEDGYGEYDDEATAYVPREEIPTDVPLEEGVEIVMEDDEGDVMSAVIVWVGADEVKLDFNHPLAGRELEFEVKVVGLRAATEEELEHGHAHVEGHEH
jgi:FKBP-type peptidyl-prolyl cis-trans isomerase SlyD